MRRSSGAGRCRRPRRVVSAFGERASRRRTACASCADLGAQLAFAVRASRTTPARGPDQARSLTCDLATMLPAIAASRRQFADATAYVAPDGWALSYRDLDRVSDELAVGLARRGLTAGDVVALVLPPSPEYPVAYLAAAKLGAITAGVNDRFTHRRAERAPRDGHPASCFRARARARRRVERRDGHARAWPRRCSASCCATDETPPALPDERPARGHRVHVGHDRPAEGRRVLQPPARVHHADGRR